MPGFSRAASPHVPRALLAVGVALALAGAFAASCSPATYVVQQYSGPELPREAVAVLRVNGGKGPRLVELDGERLDFKLIKGEHLHVEMLPGAHSVGVVNPEIDSLHGVRIDFMAEAGRTYRVIIQPAAEGLGPGWTPQVVEVDASSDQVLRNAPSVPTSGAAARASLPEAPAVVPVADGGAPDATPSVEHAPASDVPPDAGAAAPDATGASQQQP